jgi:arabinose-5-phosphate isomerase
MTTSIRDIAKRTISIEAGAIAGLSERLDENFEKAIDLINASTGRVVVTGIGKSAIVGQKIVATLNSTGTPAIFMHAADAIHGDLGMIQKDDVVIIISKSGESPEIKLLVPFIRNFKNPIIGMVGNVDSYLAKNADAVLDTFVETEACPNNLAPTSSTTAQMVMGDAVAVCLMEQKGFTGKDFAKYHPGGNLGKRLYLKVNDIYINNEKPSVQKNTSLRQVIISISSSRMGATVVVDDNNKVTGIITDGDIRRLLEKEEKLEGIDAASISGANPKTAVPDTLAAQALEILKTNDISQLIVTDESGIYLGMLHLHDLIKEGII